MRELAVQAYKWVISHELAAVLLVAVAAVGGWGFVEVAEAVFDGSTRRIDESVLLAMRTPGDVSDPLGPSWFEEGMRDVTALGSVAVLTLFTAAMAGYLAVKKQPWVAVFVVVAVLAGTAISTLMKSGYDRPRPELVPHETRIYTKSFPSGHSAMSSLIYLTLGAVMARAERDRRTRIYLIAVPVLLLLLVGASRVYMGVHWPTDVLAGWLFGVSWAAGAWLAFRFLERRFGLPVDETGVARENGPA